MTAVADVLGILADKLVMNSEEEAVVLANKVSSIIGSLTQEEYTESWVSL